MKDIMPADAILDTPRVLRGFDVRGEDIVISRADSEKELWIFSGGKAQRLCKGYSPLFLGNDILYICAEMGDRTDIFLYQNGESIPLTREGRNLAPQPSPDKTRVAFLSDGEGLLSLYVSGLCHVERRGIDPVVTSTPPSYLRSFVWAPDGKHIIYWTRSQPGLRGEVWSYSVESGEAVKLISLPNSSARVGSPYIWYLSAPCPSKPKSNIWIDQDRFVFLSDAQGFDGFGISTLGGEIQWIDQRGDRWDKEFYEVSQDGPWIACNEYIDGTTCLAFISVEDGTRREVRAKGCLSHPRWGKKGVYCWRSSPVEGTGILYIPLEGSPQLCYSEPPIYPAFEPVPVHYQTFDGRTIGGWLYNREARKVLVWLHGGPSDISLNEFDPIVQYFALNGIAVFTPNFRGSKGYGSEFERLNWNDLGGGDLKDVIAGIEYLERQGYTSFVVGGQSYGAYLAAMTLVKYPEVCGGGVCISGVYTLLPEYAATWLLTSGCVWMDTEDSDLLSDRSFACQIENLERPILAFHGGEDGYAPVSGLHYTLRKAQEVGKDHLFTVIIYEDEGHGLVKRTHIHESCKDIVAFIQKVTT
jgi:dipeptidyl aminopeptidase/acylaminoacyl peptidase